MAIDLLGSFHGAKNPRGHSRMHCRPEDHGAGDTAADFLDHRKGRRVAGQADKRPRPGASGRLKASAQPVKNRFEDKQSAGADADRVPLGVNIRPIAGEGKKEVRRPAPARTGWSILGLRAMNLLWGKISGETKASGGLCGFRCIICSGPWLSLHVSGRTAEGRKVQIGTRHG